MTENNQKSWIARKPNVDPKTFRKNWWSHLCINLKVKWIHKQYMKCDICGFHNGQTEISKGRTTL